MIVECLKCDSHYFEIDQHTDVCPCCGNKDKQKTIYLSEEGSMYKSIIEQKLMVVREGFQ